MAVNDLSRSTQSGQRIFAFFRDRNSAYQAVAQLKEAGFTSNEIGILYNESTGTRSASDLTGGARDVTGGGRDNESFWEKVKDFFSGESHDDVDYRDSVSDMNWEEERAEYYRSGIAGGGALVSVAGPRSAEARRILESAGGELRESGFEKQSFASRSTNTQGNADQDYRIQLRGEMLRTYKDRVQRGEVRVRKEVVTENQSVQVPVSREELVIERVPGSGAQVSGDIGSDKEIRVPLSEERARIEKQPVVNEEVRVGKRAVQTTQQVSDNVRHEELRVDKEGDVNVEDAGGKRRKNPAA